MPICMLSHFSSVWLFASLWNVAHQVPLSMGFSRQEYWSGSSCPPPRHLPHPGTEPASLMSIAFAGGFFTLALPGKPLTTELSPIKASTQQRGRNRI